MSANQKRMSSSKSSGLGGTNALLRQATSAKSNNDDSKNSLLSKEEEYKRLNAELEKKTATLVYEAEQVLKANERVISETSYLNKISEMDFMSSDANPTSSHYKSIIDKARHNHMAGLIDAKELSTFKKTIANFEDEADEREEREERGEEDEEYFEMAEEERRKNGQMRDLLSKISTKADDDLISNLIPKSANEMSSEAQIRFLKAKLKVMQEEIDRLSGEAGKKEEEIGKLAQRCKELDEDRSKQLRISNSHQTQLEKVRKMHDETQSKMNAQDVQFQAMKKENEQLKKDAKKHVQDEQQLELRLSRALEEIEKYKVQLQKSQSSTKDMSEQEKRRSEQIQAENKRLQKQKSELIQVFKKQLKLIDILKKQKMHLEAAKILQFSEEEFLAALEWSPQSENGPNLVNQNSTRPNNQTKNSGRPPSGPTNKARPNLPNNSQTKTIKVVSSRSLASDLNNLQEVNDVRVLSHENDDNENYEDDIYNDDFRYDNNMSENVNNNDFDDEN